MEGAVYKGIKAYWRRKRYERLNGGGRKRKLTVVRLNSGGSTSRRRRFWKLKLKPKLRFSPKKLLLRLRDAYVNMMVRFANSAAGAGYCGGKASGFGVRPAKEYDEKVIMEIYKSILAAQRQLVPRDAAWIGSEIGR